jgi:redox-sensitive bicupin YhaK (pirin superfamily)
MMWRMIRKRAAAERGRTRTDWLDSRHTFSFGGYYDPAHTEWSALLVVNDDRVAPGGGFPTHAHADMEILSYVLSGALEHKDSLGTGSVIRPGDVQRMSAGTGVRHSEFNASRTEPVHFLQIWIVPERDGLPPSYEQKRFPEAEREGRLQLIGARGGEGGVVTIHQDVRVYAGVFAAGKASALELAPGRRAWVQVADGAVDINGEPFDAGDGAAIADERTVFVTGRAGAPAGEVLVFDLP